MKIAFINEYFPPFTPGGAEWSTYYLAKSLGEKGHQLLIITPNYGAAEKEFKEKVTIVRFPFYKKINNDKLIPSSFTHTNPLWILWAAYFIFKISRQMDIEILHVHGKYSIMPTFLANIFLRRPIILTVRDYQIICNYGFCVYNKNKSCSLNEYITHDFIFYLKEYVKDVSVKIILLNIIYAIWGRIFRNILKNIALNMVVIVLSQKQKDIFRSNGFKKIKIVGNSTDFLEPVTLNKKAKFILFAGRLSDGKGVNLLIKLIPEFFEKYPSYKFIFAGDGALRENLLNLSKIYPNIKIMGKIKHSKLINLYKRSKVVIVPSLWQEPFGRIALESIAFLTPAVVTNRGGLPEIIKNNRWGYVVEPESNQLNQAIDKAIKNNNKLIGNILKDYALIKHRFGVNITNKYLEIYKQSLRTSS